MTKFRSKVEEQVSEDLHRRGFMPRYEPDAIGYSVTKVRKYTPDFKVGDVYIEVKGYWAPSDRQKFLAVLRSNPDLKIFVAFQNPHTKIARGSNTTLGEWASKHAVPWCSVPIPPDFLASWLAGIPTTFKYEMPKVQAEH